MKITTQQSGFTLIELMITVAIIAILAGIVVPNYSDYVRRSALSEAFANLSDLRVKLDQFYQNNRNYGTDACGNDGTASRISFALGGKFTYACAFNGGGSNANQAYVLTAEGGSGAAAGHTYTLDSNNARGTSSFKGSTVTNKSCWLVKGNEC